MRALTLSLFLLSAPLGLAAACGGATGGSGSGGGATSAGSGGLINGSGGTGTTGGSTTSTGATGGSTTGGSAGTSTSTTGGSTTGTSTGTTGGSTTGGSTTGSDAGATCVPDCAGKQCGPDGCGGHCGSCAANQYCDATGSCHASNIQHVVLIVQENHTFESYFGAYCQAAAGSNPTCTSGPSCCEGAPVVNGYYTEPSGTRAGVLDDSSDGDSNFATDRDHEQVCEIQQIDDGKMDRYVTGASGAMTCLGFGPDCSASANWVLAAGAAPTDTVSYYWSLAGQNALADRYFQPMAGASASNDIYFADARFRFLDNGAIPKVAAGTTNGSLCAGGPCLNAPQEIFPDPTIADLLVGGGHSFGIYADGYAESDAVAASGSCPDTSSISECPYSDCLLHPAACYGCQYDPSDYPFLYFQGFTDTAAGATPVEKDYSALAQDVASGNLPNFAFVKARMFHNEHPNMSKISDGIAFVSATVDLIEQSAYKDDTLILLTWDEGGGFFDHVAPPASPPTTVDADSSGNPVPYGTRVPLLAIGPFAKKGTISHVVMEHSSIVAFLEFNFLGSTGQLQARDGWVNGLGSLLDPAAVGLTLP